MTSLYQGFLKNIAHDGYYHHFIVSCICVFVLLYFHLWLLRTSFLRSMYPVLSENIAHDGYYCTLSFHVFAYTLYLCICITVFSRHLRTSFITSLYTVLSENIAYVCPSERKFYWPFWGGVGGCIFLIGEYPINEVIMFECLE